MPDTKKMEIEKLNLHNLDDNAFTKELQIIFEFALGGILSILALNTRENDFGFTSLIELAQLDFVQFLLTAVYQAKR